MRQTGKTSGRQGKPGRESLASPAGEGALACSRCCFHKVSVHTLLSIIAVPSQRSACSPAGAQQSWWLEVRGCCQHRQAPFLAHRWQPLCRGLTLQTKRVSLALLIKPPPTLTVSFSPHNVLKPFFPVSSLWGLGLLFLVLIHAVYLESRI